MFAAARIIATRRKFIQVWLWDLSTQLLTGVYYQTLYLIRMWLLNIEAGRSERVEAGSVRDMQQVLLDPVTLSSHCEVNRVKMIVRYLRTQESLDSCKNLRHLEIIFWCSVSWLLTDERTVCLQLL
jgi:hypothetical protein